MIFYIAQKLCLCDITCTEKLTALTMEAEVVSQPDRRLQKCNVVLHVVYQGNLLVSMKEL